jgi:ribonuclease R
VLDDPNAEREAQRYENPIPSREALLAFLGEHGAPMNAEELAAALDLSAPDRFFALTKRLGAMLRDGQLLVNRRGGYAVAEKLDLIAGTVIANQDGFGFLKPDAGGDDLFLPPYEMRQVLHGDRVLASVTGLDRRGRREGAIVEVLERGTVRLVGRYSERDGVGYVVPDDRRIHLDVLVPPGQAANARNNQIVVCEITQPPDRQRPPFGRVLEVLGDKLTPSLAVEVAIHGHGLPYQWPEPVLDQANGIALEVTAADRAGCEDLRELPLVTIDGEDAKDFDDAVYAEVDGQGFRLVVAIADVSHYVKPGSPLDEEARLRATSVYFPGFVVPMLPEVLSNGICSLKPEVERLCFVCDMRVDRNGEVSGSRFYRAVMRSHARLTYTQVWNAIGEKDPATRAKLGALLPHVERLHQLYRLLAKQRAKRGAIEFETSEVRFVLGPGGEVVQAGMLQRNDAHMLIEECMIAANVEAARFLEKRNMPAPYRVHERPPETKYTDLLEFLREFKLRMPPWNEVEPRDYTALLKKVRARADAALIESVLLRSQSLAVYSPQNSGHFGLALDAYAHFTSPIRRYADLLVHRAIGHALAGGRREAYVYSPHDMGQLALECSEKSRRAEEAEREVDERYRCAWMEQHVGGEFNGVVSGVTSFGLFIELVDSRVNGLVHVTQLPNDYYHFDPVRKLLSGERRGLAFRLGDPVCVLVLRASVEDRRIDFRLVAARGEAVGEGEAPPPMQSFPRGQRKRRR